MNEIIQEIKDNLQDYHFLILLAIIGAATYLRFQNAFFDGMWVDEGRYARIAFEVANHPWSYSTVENYLGPVTSYPPVYPYLIAFSTYLFGKTDLAVRMVSPVMGVAAVGLTYVFGKEIKDVRTGLVAASLAVVNPLMWYLSERILVGITLTVIYTATVLALYYGLEDKEYSKYALYAVGPLSAIAVMTKQPAYTLGLLIPMYFVYRKWDDIMDAYENGLKQSSLYNRDYGISVGLGVLTLLPYALRNQAVCSFPLCSLKRAASFAAIDSNAAVSSVQGGLYFLFGLPGARILTAGVTVFVAIRVVSYIVDLIVEDPDKLIRYSIITALLSAAIYFVKIELFAMVFLSSIAMFARKDSEKLMWLWIGLGVGFMSIPEVKVPRYIVFTMPAFMLLAALEIHEISDWIGKFASNNIDALKDRQMILTGIVTVLMVAPLLAMSFVPGQAAASMGGFGEIEQTRDWFNQNAPEDAQILASSPTILRYYAYPRDTYRFPDNQEDFVDTIKEKNITYLEVDTYERTAPRWTMYQLPPYRISNEDVQSARQGQISGQQIAQKFTQPPAYVTPVAQIGQERMPLTQNQAQPRIIIYRVNRTALP